MSVVVLNPGQMGSVVAAALVQAGRDTAWVSEGRSPASRERAQGWAQGDFYDLELKLVDARFRWCPSECPRNCKQNYNAGSRHLRRWNAVSPSIANAVYETVTQGSEFRDGGIMVHRQKNRDARLYPSGEKLMKWQPFSKAGNGCARD